MKHPLTIFYAVIGLLILFLFVRDTDTYKEFADPHGYWAAQMTNSSELVAQYAADANRCTDELDRLRMASSRDIWLKQKALEGLTPRQAEEDYTEALDAAEFSCKFAYDLLAAETESLQQAKTKVEQHH